MSLREEPRIRGRSCLEAAFIKVGAWPLRPVSDWIGVKEVMDSDVGVGVVPG